MLKCSLPMKFSSPTPFFYGFMKSIIYFPTCFSPTLSISIGPIPHKSQETKKNWPNNLSLILSAKCSQKKENKNPFMKAKTQKINLSLIMLTYKVMPKIKKEKATVLAM